MEETLKIKTNSVGQCDLKNKGNKITVKKKGLERNKNKCCLVNMKAINNRNRNNPYFERVIKFLGKVVNLFRVRFLKWKAKSNQEITKTASNVTKDDISPLDTGHGLPKLSIPRVTSDKDFTLDFFRFSECFQTLISNYPNGFDKYDLFNIVQSNFRSKRINLKLLFCFARLINQRLQVYKPSKNSLTGGKKRENVSDKRAVLFETIYNTCMKDVDKYLHLLSSNNICGDFSSSSKPLCLGECGENWNLYECFTRIHTLASFAISNQLNKRVSKANDTFLHTQAISNSPVVNVENFEAIRIPLLSEKGKIFHPQFKNAFNAGNFPVRDDQIYKTSGLDNDCNIFHHVINQANSRLGFQDQITEKLSIRSSNEIPANETETSLLPSPKNVIHSKMHQTIHRECFFSTEDSRSKLYAAMKVPDVTENRTTISVNSIEGHPGKLNGNIAFKASSKEEKLDFLKSAGELKRNSSNVDVKTEEEFPSPQERIKYAKAEKIQSKSLSYLSDIESNEIGSAFKRISQWWKPNVIQSAKERIFSISSVLEGLNAIEAPSKYSSSHTSEDVTNSENNLENKVSQLKFKASNIALKTESKFLTPQAKHIVDKKEFRTGHKRKFQTSLKYDDVKRVFHVLEPKYRSPEYFSCLPNNHYSSANEPKRMRMSDQRSIMVDRETNTKDIETTVYDQVSNMDDEAAVMDGQETTIGEQVKKAHGHDKIVFHWGTNMDDQAAITYRRMSTIDEQKTNGNYRETFVHHQETVEDHGEENIDDQVEYVDAHEISGMEGENTILDGLVKNEDDQETIGNHQDSNKDGQEKNGNYETISANQNLNVHRQEATVDNQKINILITKRKRYRRSTPNIYNLSEVKPQRLAKLKAMVLLKTPRRVRRNLVSSI